jgi:peptide/nickel transport system substrate-binding protein
LNHARDPKEGLWGFLLASIDSVEATAPDTIVLHLKTPDPSLPAALATFNAAIMPHKLFEATPGATDDDKAKAFAEHPIGSGPFMLTAWTRDSSMTLKRNPYYWGKDADGVKLPYLDEVHCEIIPDDATRILKLRSGEADVAEFIPYARVKEMQDDAQLTMNLFPSTQVTYLTTNNRPKLLDGSANPLGDERVRQALNYAINKKAIIQIVTHGIGSPMHSFFAATTPLYYDGGEAYPYDTAKAKQLLADAGYAGGMSLSIQILAGSADDIATASALQQMWTPLGVKLSVEQVDSATQDDRQHKGDFQIRTTYWTNDISDPNEITSYLAYFPTNGNGYSGWQDKAVDALFEKSQVELDPAKRAEEYKEIQQLYMKAAPEMFLYESPFPAATRKGVKDFYQSALGNDNFVHATVTH